MTTPYQWNSGAGVFKLGDSLNVGADEVLSGQGTGTRKIQFQGTNNTAEIRYNDGGNQRIELGNGSGGSYVYQNISTGVLTLRGGGESNIGTGASTDLNVGTGGSSPNAVSMVWGDGTGWKLRFGTTVASAFAERFSFLDTGYYRVSSGVRNFDMDAVNGRFGMATNHSFDFMTNNTVRWTVSTTGALVANATNGGGITVHDTTMIHSNVALTNGAAAAAGTLTNAPAAGNPTKWIPIDDNGTTRYIPAW